MAAQDQLTPHIALTTALRSLLLGASATLGLIALNLLLFAYQARLTPEQYELFVLRWAAIPVEIAEQADFPPTTPFPIQATLLSALFLHASLAHLAGNMALLALFGARLERAIGGWRVLALFVVGGIAGGLAQVYANPQSLVPLVGASGAIAALMIAALLLAPGSTAHLLVFTGWAALQAAATADDLRAINQIGGGTAVWSHIGGLAAGLLGGLLLHEASRIPHYRDTQGTETEHT